MWIPGAIFGLLLLIAVIRDPRRLRCAILFLAMVVSFLFFGVSSVVSSQPHDKYGPYILFALVVLAIVVVVILGVVLILNGFTMVRQEGRRLSNLLGLLLGVLMVGYVSIAVWAVLTSNTQGFVWVILVGFPLVFLGFGFVAYLLYSWIYLFAARRWGPPPDAIIVLGAGLINDQVPPLLASRLDGGIALLNDTQATTPPLLVVSGGRGSDEARSEAEAMAEYLVDKGIDVAQIIEEPHSRTTKENISLSGELLAQRGCEGTVVAVTNTFHSFRSAMLMSRARMKGYALGSPTAKYFWPAAVIREYAAILADSLGFVIMSLVVCLMPLALFILVRLVGR
jgi:uncharacterized SAM-binding protein YcdF (DUF218 family)